VEGYSLPDGFAAQLEQVLAPGDSEAAAAIIADALLLDDDGLGAFLEGFAARVASSSNPVTAAELRSLLARISGSSRSASRRRSQ
jgi:hypothetical protein